MQVGDEDDADLARVQPSGLERAKRCRAAVQQDRGVIPAADMDARLEAPSAAKGVTGAREGHGDAASERVA